MLKRLYQSTVLTYPHITLLFVLGLVSILASQVSKVEIDASSETLLLKEDKDLAFTREINQRYSNPEFLVITYRPENAGLLDSETLTNLESLSSDLEKLEMIESVTSILNVPLLLSSGKPLNELVSNIPTLSSENIDQNAVRDELLTSPIYSNNLVSSDFSTTAIQVNYKGDPRYFELLYRRNELLNKVDAGTITDKELIELDKVRKDFKQHRDVLRKRNHETITQIRSIMNHYRSDAELFLGGVNMIADDMTTFIESDLKTYGSAVLIILISILYVIFRQKRYIILPVSIAVLSVIVTTGLLGLFNWEVTVISSNFISLQLIITMSLVIHLCVRYREELKRHPDKPHKEIIQNATTAMFIPCLYVITTTVAGFSSLAVSNILPVMNLGWMMSTGISVSFIITFLVFPAAMALWKKEQPFMGFENNFVITRTLGKFAEKHGKLIYFSTFLLVIFSITGASRLIVENSFIDYFKKDTEIYQGMKFIDSTLGGTTPLDIIVDFPEETEIPTSTSASDPDDFFDEFSEEFSDESTDAQYWFTSLKMQKIERVHDYLDSIPEIGKVLSFATTLKTGRLVNNGNDLDNLQLALIYNKLPEKFRSVLLDPYVDINNNQARFTVRIIDSLGDLRRNQLLERIRNELPSHANINPENIKLSGMMVLYNNMLQSLFNSQIKTLGLVLIILGLMFLTLFRSTKIAVVATIANFISIAIVFGLMGWTNIPLDMMTITIAAISMGIAVDDAIHYIHRFRIEVRHDGNYIAAMHRSHASIGYAMYYTTMAIIVGFSVLILSNFVPTIYFGLLTVIAMLSALTANLLLLPRLLIWMKPFNNSERQTI